MKTTKESHGAALVTCRGDDDLGWVLDVVEVSP